MFRGERNELRGRETERGLRYVQQNNRRVEEMVGNLEVWAGWFLGSTTEDSRITQRRNNEVCSVVCVWVCACVWMQVKKNAQTPICAE